MAYTVEHLEDSRKKFEPLPALRAVLGALLELDGPPVKLLDCGCGTGFFTRQYARLPGVAATGLDMDDTLLDAARDLAVKDNLDITFVHGDILRLPFPDGSFDRAASDILLEIFPDTAVPVGELARVCKPGGKVLCIEPNYRSYVYYDPRLSQEDNLQISAFYTLGREFGAGPGLPDAFRRAGLEDVKLAPWFWGGAETSTGTPEDSDAFLRERLEEIGFYRSHGVAEAECAAFELLFRRAAEARRSSPATVLSGLDVYLVCGRKPL